MNPPISELVEAARRFDRDLGDHDLIRLEGRLRALLFEPRRCWDCWREGLITAHELRDLLVAHTQTFLEDTLGPTVAVEEVERELAPAFELALFGARLQEH
jgi:hypothetical protein